MTRRIFLDANASVPVLADAKRAFLEALEVSSGANPSSPHTRGRTARRVLDVAREQIAQAMASGAKDVFLTSGASEGNRLVVDMLLAHARRTRPLVVAASPLEHPSLARPLAAAAGAGLIELRRFSVDNDAVAFDDESLRGVDAVVCTAAHNETGLLPGITELSARLPDDVVFVVDASQSLARRGPPPARADVIVGSAHKVGAIAGAGAVVVRHRARAWPTPWTGGGQENGLRPGTEATALHAAFGAVCAVIDDVRLAHVRLEPVCGELVASLVRDGVGHVVGGSAPRLCQTAAILVPGVDADALRMMLDVAGVDVGFGAACSALSPEPSPGLRALGVSDADSRRVVRLSLAPGTTSDDVAEAAERIRAVVARLRL
jgi:cysteine desulfurase